MAGRCGGGAGRNAGAAGRAMAGGGAGRAMAGGGAGRALAGGGAGRATAGGGAGRAMAGGAAGRAAGAGGAALLGSWAYAPVLAAITETLSRNAAKRTPGGSMIALPGSSLSPVSFNARAQKSLSFASPMLLRLCDAGCG